VRSAERPVIWFGDVWEYNDKGRDLGSDWQTDYGDWDEGPGQLGYGDGDEETELRDEDPNVPSYYFRNRVQIDENFEVVGAELDVLYDDGFAVWVNGERVFEKNVEDGVDFGTYASSGSDDNARAETELDFSENSPFREGENIVAVMVKQRSKGSSDVSFDLSLDVELRVRELEEPDAADPGTDGEDAADGVAGGEDVPAGGGDSSARDNSGGGGGSGGGSGGGGCECRAGGTGGSGPSPVALVGLVLVAGVARAWEEVR
jgi:MYXO-CTERM domain-containing protein